VFNSDVSVLPALDHQNNAPGLVGPDIVSDDSVGSFRFVACQRFLFNGGKTFSFNFNFCFQIACPPVG
jgi:hypothetical protein